jgi:hypothetical protein
MDSASVSVWDLLERHCHGDWGQVRARDAEHNQQALDGAGPLLSAYTLPTGARVLIVTDDDRTKTTALLSRELREDRLQSFGAWFRITTRPR